MERGVQVKRGRGFGVKNLGLFNLALLGKWRWRMLSSSESLWVKVLRSIYGVEAVVRGGLVDVECFKKGSSWWRDLGCVCNRDNGFNKGWFNEGVRRRVGSGQSTLFWRDIWVGGECLKNCFERLFQVTLNKDACISSMDEWRNGVWCWLLNWRRSLFLWEQDEVNDLLNKVEEVRLVQGNEDGWLWVHDKNGTYSVRNAYKVLQNEVRNDNYLHYKRLWASKVPSKLKCFAWRLFVGGVPTRMNLARRGIIGSLPSTLCAFCGELEESSDHLFFTCSLSYSVWQKLYSLFGIYSILPSSTGSNFLSHWHLFGEAKNFHQQWMTIWFVTIWSLWLVRNKIIFEESSFNLDENIIIIFSLPHHFFFARFNKESSFEVLKVNKFDVASPLLHQHQHNASSSYVVAEKSKMDLIIVIFSDVIINKKSLETYKTYIFNVAVLVIQQLSIEDHPKTICLQLS
ncbi:PREDICTED: uncharacterized protein LOC109350421 [Lupinus angustifolius]|uniref:uncharacterized protein LOC109350421 n=1 Tax=Lupinus angustifolius TaxID=3871 RepID=UPI00092F1762|nr:PREDICTED: uncharacterized protein LOC109350421 [Lupinus angustifolius]